MNSFAPRSDTVSVEPSAARHDGSDWLAKLASLRVPSVAAALLIAALWMLARPYRGIRHDAILYVGQTLSRLMPDSIGQDLFMVYGSQDRYSVFSRMMAPLAHALGVADSQTVVLFICEIAFVAGCWLLTADLPSRFARWCALLALVAVSHTYGGDGRVSFAEPFLTARVVAEPLLLVALALLMRGRMAAAASITLVAAAVHPLITLPVLATGWIYLCLRDRRWLWGVAVIALAAAMGAFGLAPFDALFRRYDPDWLAVVKSANWLVFMANNSMRDWAPTAFDVIVLLLAAKRLPGSAMAHLIKALLICALAFTLLWGIGADLLSNVLVTELQLWRVFWLTHLLGVLLLPMLLLDFWSRGGVGRWCAATFVLAAVAVTANLGTGWLCVVWCLPPMAVLRSPAQVAPGIVRLATGVTLLATGIVTLLVGWQTFQVVATLGDRFNGASGLQIALGLSILTAAVGYVVLRGLAAGGKWGIASMAAVLALTAFGVSSWDQRSDWQHFVENGLEEKGLPFEGLIPPTASVYWDDSLLDPWMLLHRPQFYDAEQGAGALFNRPNAMEFEVRRKVITPLLVQKELCSAVAGVTGAEASGPGACAPDSEVLREICHPPGHPDFLVFRTDTDAPADSSVATWRYRPGDPKFSRTYRLYACAQQQ